MDNQTQRDGMVSLFGQSQPDADKLLCREYHEAIEFIGRRWMGAILYMLMPGPRRFNELLGSIPGLSDRLLTQRLRELEGRGLALRRVMEGSPVRVEYELTEAGRDLQEVVSAILQWGRKWPSSACS